MSGPGVYDVWSARGVCLLVSVGWGYAEGVNMLTPIYSMLIPFTACLCVVCCLMVYSI